MPENNHQKRTLFLSFDIPSFKITVSLLPERGQ